MKKHKVEYTDEPIGKVKIVHDSLLSQKELHALVGVLGKGKISEKDYKKYLEDKYL